MVEQEIGCSFFDDFEQQIIVVMLYFYVIDLQLIIYVVVVIVVIGQFKCVVLSGMLDKIYYGLICVGFYDLFVLNIFLVSQVVCGKLVLDLFLFVVVQMKVVLEWCLVIEDSVLGVIGVCVVGMIVLGFYGGGYCFFGYVGWLQVVGVGLIFDDMC